MERYRVLLDVNSAVGRMYAHANPPYPAAEGPDKHPILDCIEIGFDNPFYLQVKSSLARFGGGHQTLLIPHHAIVSIVRYNETERPRLGYPVPCPG